MNIFIYDTDAVSLFDYTTLHFDDEFSRPLQCGDMIRVTHEDGDKYYEIYSVDNCNVWCVETPQPHINNNGKPKKRMSKKEYRAWKASQC